MKKNVVICFLLFFVCAGVLYSQIAIKFATIAPNGSLWTKNLRRMGKAINRRTRGQIKFLVRVYPRKERAEQAIMEALLAGKLDGALFLQSGIERAVPQLALLKLPYFYDNYEQWEKAHQALAPSFEKKMAAKGLRLCGWLDGGFAYLFSTSSINSLDDFRRARTWLYPGDPLVESCFREIGANGVAVGIPEVKERLRKSELDCVYASPYFLIALGWHSHVRRCVDIPISNVIGGLVLREEIYRKIPARYRRGVERTCHRYMERMAKKVHSENRLAIRLLREKYGVQFAPPGEKWARELRQLGAKIADKQVGKSYTLRELQQLRKIKK